MARAWSQHQTPTTILLLLILPGLVRTFLAERWGGRWISTIPNTDQVVIVGPREFQGWSMYVVDVNTQAQTALLVLPDDISGVSVNPGGSMVLFASVPVSGDDVEDQFDLFEVPVGGGVQQVRFSSPVPSVQDSEL